ncbi:MAG: hypothetical protein IKS59_03380 [Aeriscardovia sp.]|nr:hypothetical protein [Aeriscardovia sp.]
MYHWTEYYGHEFDVIGNLDNTIYTFDIESTSYLDLYGQQVNACDYLSLSEADREAAIPKGLMYIWQFSINDNVYYGRTWEEFRKFLERLEENSEFRKIVFVHNLSFEFQFLRTVFSIKKVLSRKSRKVMSAELNDFNITFRCTYYMSNCALAKLPEVFNLPVEKQVGDLDYDKIRTPKTPLTAKEMKYCEYDCLVVYEYIKIELQTYKTVNKIPMTATGKVRKELQAITLKDPKWRKKIGACINIKPSVYNMLIEAFAGGYTHANYIYTDEVLKNVDSYDETSAYPYVLVSYRFPMGKFKECRITAREDMIENFAYLIRVRFTNINSKYYNNFISASKCLNFSGAKLDNGRIKSAREITITLTDVDFKFILDTYEVESYEILESYFTKYEYLPKKFIKFVLQKYINKTQYKDVEGKEVEYALEKGKFNSIYGMTVTNMIRDEVDYDDVKGWNETPLTNTDIFDKLVKEKNKGFLSFAWGVWVTAYARDNLLRRVIELDKYVVYCDTDSIKLVQGYDRCIFTDYNESVIKRIKNTCQLLDIPFDSYAPKDSKGIHHLLGIFENETGKGREVTYDKFITQGAKKYAVEINGEIKITVSGVPKKKGSKCIKRIEEFRDDLVFDADITNKKNVMYNDDQAPFDLIDYLGLKYRVKDKSACCLLPATYTLGKSLEYADLLTDNSSDRAKFRENV